VQPEQYLQNCAATATISAGAAPGLFTEGWNRYSISIMQPSGGVNGLFDCMKRLSLSKVIRSVCIGWLYMWVQTGHKGGRKACVCIGKIEKEVRCS